MVGDREDAEEALQDAFVRAYRSLARCDDPGRFGAWLYGILVNRCRTVGARASRRRTLFGRQVEGTLNESTGTHLIGRLESADAPTRTRSPGRPLGWSGLAAPAVFAALLITRPWSRQDVRPDSYQFVLIAPNAASVALVGDFNDWNPARSPMRATHAGIWATVLPLAPGRYHYAFLVNGVEWRRDPAAPAALDDDFRSPRSVVTVGHS